MKNILVLGAGLVAGPLVRYLLNQPEIHLSVASLYLSDAQKLVKNHSNGKAIQLNVDDDSALSELITNTDIVVSLLPWTYHVRVARKCLALHKHMVTASYVKPEMQALNEAAKKAGLLFLNEIGVDPGIDHMAAMHVINRAKAQNGKITSFYSYCGGLPALAANNNPFGYKFSWSPTGVMLAAMNSGRYLKNGQIVDVPTEKLFEHYWLLDVPGAGVFEAYVNRDALPYKKIYQLTDAVSMYRGTLRNIGHCESWNMFKKLHLFDREIQFDFSVQSPTQVMARLIGSPGKNIRQEVAAYLAIPEYAITLHKLQWLGMFSSQPVALTNGTAFDLFAHLMQEKLVFAPGEQDLLIQHHEFIIEYPNQTVKHTSTMIDEGIPSGDTSMARTVSLPVAIATRLLAENKLNLTGVHIPILPEIYEPVLAELATLNISLKERTTEL